MLDRIAHLLRVQKPIVADRGLLWGSGSVVPTDGTDGYQVGCFFQHTDGGSGTAFYINEGSVTACDFNPVDAGDLDTVLQVGEFSSLTAGSGLPLSSTQTSAVVAYGDDAGLAITANVYNLRTRLLLTVDQSDTSIRALMAQLKLKDGVDVATGVYTASQGYLELAGTHISKSGATLSCMDASLEIGTLLTIDSGGEVCGLHVETTGSGTITNNGTCAGVLIDKAAGAASWPVGLEIEPTSCTKAFTVGSESVALSGSGVAVSAATADGLHYGAELYFDDGGVALTAGWVEAFRVGYLVSTATTGADIDLSASHVYTYLAESVSTTGGFSGLSGSLLVKTGKTITISSGIGDFAGIYCGIDVPSGAIINAGTFACGLSIGGDLGGTHTGKAVGIRLQEPSAGAWDGLLSLPAAGTAPCGAQTTADYTFTKTVKIAVLIGDVVYYLVADTV